MSGLGRSDKRCRRCGGVERYVVKRPRSKQRRRHERHPESQLLRAARTQARQKGLEFDLVVADIVIPETCPVLGMPLKLGRQPGPRDSSPSIDRFDNDKGYTRDNVRVISFLANRIKCTATSAQVIAVGRWMRKEAQACG